MPKPDIRRLLTAFPLISEQVNEREMRVIVTELMRQLETIDRFSLVEFGCYIGTTSLCIQRVLEFYAPQYDFHVYDSFAGLPNKTPSDYSPVGEQFRPGELATSRRSFELRFKKAGLRLPHIHKGWFSETTPADVPDTIGFAFLDGDFYESIRDSLRLVGPKLHRDAVVIVDDYVNEALPGAALAVDEWLRAHPGLTCRSEASLAIVRRSTS